MSDKDKWGLATIAPYYFPQMPMSPVPNKSTFITVHFDCFAANCW